MNRNARNNENERKRLVHGYIHPSFPPSQNLPLPFLTLHFSNSLCSTRPLTRSILLAPLATLIPIRNHPLSRTRRTCRFLRPQRKRERVLIRILFLPIHEND